MSLVFRRLVLVGLALLSAGVSARGGESPAQSSADSNNAFAKGMREFQSGAGFAVSENYYSLERPQLNDADLSARLGWMLNSPGGKGIWRGNFEVLGEVFGGAVVKGPGNALVGLTLLLRRNMIFRGTRLIPYYQFGIGGVYSDAHKSRPQRILGSPLLFDVQGGIGARYLLGAQSALFLELDFRHISDAGLAKRNLGLNSGVGWMGACFFF